MKTVRMALVIVLAALMILLCSCGSSAKQERTEMTSEEAEIAAEKIFEEEANEAQHKKDELNIETESEPEVTEHQPGADPWELPLDEGTE